MGRGRLRALSFETPRKRARLLRMTVEYVSLSPVWFRKIFGGQLAAIATRRNPANPSELFPQFNPSRRLTWVSVKAPYSG